jgi:cytochrome c
MFRIASAGLALAALLCAAPGTAQAGDPAAGQKVFAVCKACHQVGESAKNAVGPKLNGVVGRAAAGIEGYKYSDAMKSSGLTWDEATLGAYIQNPKQIVPGGKMAYPGLKDATKVEDVIAYLGQFDADGKAP